MAPSSRRLAKFGFLSGDGKSAKRSMSKEEWEEAMTSKSDEELEKWADHHQVETSYFHQVMNTSYPKPMNEYYLSYESFSRPLESYYFWAINHLNDLGYGRVEKITDLFAASEQSAMYGSSAQRLGLAQDKVSSFMMSIGRLIKDLFAMVREVRVMDERLDYYNEAMGEDLKVKDTAEIALKSLFVELVEGGAKNTNSVYGLARELNFVVLPDLFFSTHPQKVEDIKPMVQNLDFNRKVKEVLEKKLYQYLKWREKTYKEHVDRRRHLIKYVKQHHDTIQMYMTWVKPYLRHIKRLGADQSFLDSKDIISAFEGAMMEIEVLGIRSINKSKGWNCCLLLTFKYRTSPTMSFSGQDYKQGPLHMGKIEVYWRAYTWTDKMIEDYMSMRDDEDLEMLGSIDRSVKDAMEGLGDSLKQYLAEAEGKPAKKEEKMVKFDKRPGIADPFMAVGKAFSDFLHHFVPPIPSFLKSSRPDDKKASGEAPPNVKGVTKMMSWIHYKNFKKSHRFVTW